MNPLRHKTYLQDWAKWSEKIQAQPGVIKRLGEGLTNHSYLIESSIGPLVLRVNHSQGTALGINRKRETQILEKLSPAGIAPALVYSDPQERYLVYRYAEGQPWKASDLDSADKVKKLQSAIARYQQVELNIEPRNYRNYLQDYWDIIEQRCIETDNLNKQWQEFLPKLEALEKSNYKPVLCHHDLLPENILETGDGLKIIDWEYAHLGHPELDWATISNKDESPASELRDWLSHLWYLIR